MSEGSTAPVSIPARARVVYDCNTLLQALASPHGPAGSCVQLVLDGSVELFVSPKVIGELRDVSNRPRVVSKLRLTSARTESFIDAILAAATLLTAVPEVFILERDPDDSHYINLALYANASVVVSRDLDLLDLMKADDLVGIAFRNRFPTIRILTPSEFLRDVSSTINP